VYGAQPMIAQTRRVLRRHGDFRELVLTGTGHFPYAQRPAEFARALHDHVAAATARRR
jgi:pimeloyl-ACP methyl ester carboxylesterase